MTKTVKKYILLCLAFLALFLINALVLKGLAILGFKMEMSSLSYLLPPLLSLLVLYVVERLRPKR